MRGFFCFLIVVFAWACAERREPPSAGGVHPAGWADQTSPSFHAQWLQANQFPLQRCQECHGDDFLGGATGVSCSRTGCHSDPKGAPVSPIACTTCHGANGSPRPATGAHWAHAPFCDTCHAVPTQDVAAVQKHANGDASSLVRFGGIAGSGATFDGQTKQCSSTYCHGTTSPAWTATAKLDCSGCHQAPHASHTRWSRLTTTTDTCQSCHPNPLTDAQHATHVNGKVDLANVVCTTCHGDSGHASPPVDLAGGTDPKTRGVGAHARHLDPSLSDRIASPVLCNDCHVVPANVTDPGHIDHADTLVRFPFGGSYEATNATCNVWCHWDKTTGPTWTDDTGGARKCDACHAFPPVVTRANTPHPTVAGDVEVCKLCHVYGKATHVNGVVDFQP